MATTTTIWGPYTPSHTVGTAESRKHRTFITYTLTETDTEVILTSVSMGFELNKTFTSPPKWTWSFSGSIAASGSTSTTYVSGEGITKTVCSGRSVTFNKSTVAQTFTITASVSDSYYAATCVLTVTVPALRGEVKVNDGGIWKRGYAYVNVEGVWKLGKVYVNDNGTWKLSTV